jgi:hypothetical protein
MARRVHRWAQRRRLRHVPPFPPCARPPSLTRPATGVVSWDDPTTAGIKAAAASLARAAPALAQRMRSPDAAYTHVVTPARASLVLGANLNYAAASASLADVLGAGAGSVTQVFDGGARVVDGVLLFDNVQSGAWVVKASA